MFDCGFISVVSSVLFISAPLRRRHGLRHHHPGLLRRHRGSSRRHPCYVRPDYYLRARRYHPRRRQSRRRGN